ncbi:hypothetical protein [Corynebacterium occultum]|uniref:hypothetical protein n=1 Tax=Corynebacterium occultum TaxID=2675219 RepID=UPI0012E17979|nr:hypothetical protein [Corynebacterium occultum]
MSLAAVVDEPIKDRPMCSANTPILREVETRGFDAWETNTGIGLIFADGTDSRVEWFQPKDLNACPESEYFLCQLDPDQNIMVSDIPTDFGGADDNVMVKTLSYH